MYSKNEARTSQFDEEIMKERGRGLFHAVLFSQDYKSSKAKFMPLNSEKVHGLGILTY